MEGSLRIGLRELRSQPEAGETKECEVKPRADSGERSERRDKSCSCVVVLARRVPCYKLSHHVAKYYEEYLGTCVGRQGE
jgi:hypothetical protein